jgi:hypothetical protein
MSDDSWIEGLFFGFVFGFWGFFLAVVVVVVGGYKRSN